ncbi:hypothetical protein BCAR13_1210008 [Paraburkholderia caribensis]|nr:hypothetical protein BCAR13_1210008 [Paraburkholderia caribensis]
MPHTRALRTWSEVLALKAGKPTHSLPQLGPLLFPGDGQAARCEPLSLVTFFAAAKKVTAAPHRGNA